MVADEEKFAAEQLAVKQKQEAEAKKQTDINRERQKIAEKKVSPFLIGLCKYSDYIQIAQAQNREWDTGKPGICMSDCFSSGLADSAVCSRSRKLL